MNTYRVSFITDVVDTQFNDGNVKILQLDGVLQHIRD